MNFTDPGARPVAVTPLFENIPEELRLRAQWVGWSFVRKDEDERWAKIPFNARTLKYAKTNNSRSWSTFIEAMAAFKRGGLDGIGYVFSSDDEYAGIDLDNCLDAEGSITSPLAREWANKLQSYTEKSPTGTGLHVIVKAVVGAGLKRGGIELYDRARYFTVTGYRVGDEEREIHSRQKLVDKLKSILTPDRPPKVEHQQATIDDVPPEQASSNGKPATPPVTVDEMLEVILRSKQAAKFSQLNDGDDSEYDSPSEADQALCSIAVFWDESGVLVDEVFRRSARMRPKWDVVHNGNGETYGQMTIATALRGCTKFYNWAAAGDDYLADDVKPEKAGGEISFITNLHDFIGADYGSGDEVAFHLCRGEVGIIQSVTNQCKSTMVRNALLCVAAGKPFPPLTQSNQPLKVVLLNYEGAGGRFQNDIQTMLQVFTENELETLRENFFISHAPEIDDEPLSLSRSMNLFEAELRKLASSDSKSSL